MKLAFKVWLDNGGKAFGDGPYEILANVDRLGSLRKAAKAMGMSYSQAWGLVRTLERRLGFALLERRTGGDSGGGSELTASARELMERYVAFRNEAEKVLQELYRKHFAN